MLGKRRMIQLIEDLTEPDVLSAGYKAMAADQEREAEAMEWCEAMILEQLDLDSKPAKPTV